MRDAPEEPAIRRILVGLDASPQSLAALEAAAELAASLHAELFGLFVEDADLLRSVDLPFTREVSWMTVRSDARSDEVSSASVERQFRVLAARARRALEGAAARARCRYRFQVLRGNVVAELLAASTEADLVMLGRAGTAGSSRRKVGTTARRVLSGAPVPVLLLRHGLILGDAVLLVYDDTPEAEDALEVAVGLIAALPELPLKVLVVSGEAEHTHALLQDLKARYEDHIPYLHFRPLTRTDVGRLAERVRREQGSLVIIPSGSPLFAGDRLQRFLAEVDSPVLLVRTSPAPHHTEYEEETPS